MCHRFFSPQKNTVDSLFYDAKSATKATPSGQFGNYNHLAN